MNWQFWIDVGGTFTDCIGRCPDGSLAGHKLLSSGITKGLANDKSTAARIVDSSRRDDPPGFWQGYELRIVDDAGEIMEACRIKSFDKETGALSLERPLSAAPAVNARYELCSGEEAPVVGIRYLMQLRLDEPIPKSSIRLGTTRGTNALITRRGANTALVITSGFGDLLHIGYQNRPKLFELDIRKPEPLFSQVAEVEERIAADGSIIVPLNESIAREKLQRLKDSGIESLAICLLHSFAHPEHERRLSEIACDIGFEEVSVSHEVAPLIKIVSRGDTTVVDAYLNPVLRSYVRSLRQSIGESELRILTSAGGLVAAEHFRGKDSILSGPAGGVVGFSKVARAAGFEKSIGFDMGGTSTDVSRFDGHYELQYETEKSGVRIVAPMMAIETVAAGGGSICHFDGVKISVGPDSAGADPGPACYGRGGPLAVTDMNLYLGKVVAEHFPFALDRHVVERKLDALCDLVNSKTGTNYQAIELADGFARVANANMAKAIRNISIAQGCDPKEYLLVAFGGAAGQHACALARELRISHVLCHPDAGLLSAYGIGLADVVRHKVEGIYQRYSDQRLAEIDAVFERLIAEARGEVLAEGIPTSRITAHRSLDIRYRGLDTFLNIREPGQGSDYALAYEQEHKRLYGYVQSGRELEIVAVRVQVVGSSDQSPARSHSLSQIAIGASRSANVFFEGRFHPTGIFRRADLHPGGRIEGPAIICEPTSTTVVDPGWHAEVLSGGEVLLTDQTGPEVESVASESDPVMLEIFNNQFTSIAEQMGVVLRNSATSVNVKERLDFSCAIFNEQGDLVVNAPHIPVHLGAMGETVRSVIADNRDLRPGDVIITNDPFRGGSHLPDVTVITPVYCEDQSRILFFAASRAHHAEIGGITPGSMPPFSTRLSEEGVLIRNFKLVDQGISRFDELAQLLRSGPFPSRAVADNLADISAQVAANQHGMYRLLELVDRFSLSIIEAYMRHIQDAAEKKLRNALSRLPDGSRQFREFLDDGSPIAVAIQIDGDSVTIDFSGTAPVSPTNLNANRAISTAAVMYCLRCLIQEDVPLNQGVLKPVSLVIPAGLLNPPPLASPEDCAAVVGGNVETSQRIVDVLLAAFGLAAASQGTMNNVLFGNDTFGYYETICGGAGATPQAAGADAVHTHMTNTRLTDPEVLETRYPVRLVEFSVRKNSGGIGKNMGGCGVVRRLEFLQRLDVSILSQRRGEYPPFGMAGGGPGRAGRNLLHRQTGETAELSGRVHFVAEPGDRLTIETPGGGAWGPKSESTA